MRALIPRRFGLRTLLVLVAVCSVALFYVRERRRLEAAEYSLEVAKSQWLAGAKIMWDVVPVDDRLFEVESSIIWIGKRTATERRIVRLKELLNREERQIRVTMYGDDAGEPAKAACEKLRNRIELLETQLQ